MFVCLAFDREVSCHESSSKNINNREKENTAAVTDSGYEIFFQIAGELSGILRLNIANTTAEDRCFSFVNVHVS